MRCVIMHVPVFIALFLTAASAASYDAVRIVGGSVTTIDNYPSIVALLVTHDGGITYRHNCGGTILNQRSVLSAAHCFVFVNMSPSAHRMRVGSTWANSGGIVHAVNSLIMHPNFNSWTFDSDIAILRSATTIGYTNVVQPAGIASATYDLRDNEIVWAAGWGAISYGGAWSEQLRHVQIWTVNQAICNQRYPTLTNNMLCSGWLDVGGRDQCSGDSGGPLYHHGTVVGVCSFGEGCATPEKPGVNARVSRFTAWIQANA